MMIQMQSILKLFTNVFNYYVVVQSKRSEVFQNLKSSFEIKLDIWYFNYLQVTINKLKYMYKQGV